MQSEEVCVKRIETEDEVNTYIARLKYILQSEKVTFRFQKDRRVDETRNKKYTNRYTILYLFPEEDEVAAIKRALSCLSVKEYIETVKDKRFPNLSEMRVFSKKYAGEDVYIKIRVELLSSEGSNCIFVMSFHFAENAYSEKDFPYGKGVKS